jgi:lipoate-protein ligase A
VPFLCFERRTAGDILCEGRKIAGSAQRRHRGAVLQHGSILLERSRFAPELPGIRELSGRRLDANDVALRMCNALAIRFGLHLVISPPSSDIMDSASVFEVSKFAAEDWLRLR